jgi:hypothetical protein
MFIAFNRRNLYRTYNETACASFWYWFLLVVWDLSNTLLAFIWECKLVFLVWRQLVVVHKEQQFGRKGHWLVAGQNFLPLSMIPSFFPWHVINFCSLTPFYLPFHEVLFVNLLSLDVIEVINHYLLLHQRLENNYLYSETGLNQISLGTNFCVWYKQMFSLYRLN